MKRKTLAWMFAGICFGVPTVISGAHSLMKMIDAGRWNLLVAAAAVPVAIAALMFIMRERPWD